MNATPRERPLLFSAPMVKAILAGRKTQTRRLYRVRSTDNVEHERGPLWELPSPYGSPGDLLWVRETWGLHAYGDESDWLRSSVRGLSADELIAHWKLALRADWGPMQDGCYWRPGIHMPRWASRITLEVTEVRAQRLHDISEDDAKAEGAAWRIAPGGDLAGAFDGLGGEIGYVAHFRDLWGSINGKRAPWSSNPWVWAITFRRLA